MDWINGSTTNPMPQGQHNLEDKQCSAFMLHKNATYLNGKTNLDRDWHPSIEGEELAVANRVRFSSYDNEEILHHDKANEGSDISIDRVSFELEKLSVFETEIDTADERCYPDTEFSDVIDDRLNDNQDRESVSSSEYAKRRVSSQFWISYWEELKAKQRDPHCDIDLNKGWNRHIYHGLREHFKKTRTSSPNTQILSDFAAFSLRAQQSIIPFPLNLARFFRYVFSTTGSVNGPFHTCRSRVLCARRPNLPTTMIRCRRPMVDIAPDGIAETDMEYTAARSINLFDFAPATVHNICLWLSHSSRGNSRAKRPLPKVEPMSKASSCRPEKFQRSSLSGRRLGKCNPHFKSQHCNDRHYHRQKRTAWDDEWRKRMRCRAAQGGRWTDGTLRQDQMWATLHWVLDGEILEDPTQQKRAFEMIV